MENPDAPNNLVEGAIAPAFKLLLACPTGLSSSQISVDLSPAYDRIPHPDSDLEKSISEIWDERVQKNPALFNGLKFRYQGHIFHNAGDINHEPHVCLHLGLTDYRTFVGTNLSPLWGRFVLQSEDDSSQCQHTSSPLGNGAIVQTSDNKLLVLQRSTNVGEFPGHYVFPGGHPEPEEIGVKSHEVRQNDCHQVINQKASEEMFDSIIREVVEEIGVPADTLSCPVFIGVSRRVVNVRPAAFFFIKCNLLSAEIQQLYSNARDSFESTHLYAVSMVGFLQLESLDVLASQLAFPLINFTIYPLLSKTLLCVFLPVALLGSRVPSYTHFHSWACPLTFALYQLQFTVLSKNTLSFISKEFCYAM